MSQLPEINGIAECGSVYLLKIPKELLTEYFQYVQLFLQDSIYKSCIFNLSE